MQSVAFSISALPPEGAFQMFTHFEHLWPLSQKSYIQIFKRRSGCKIFKRNVPGGVFSAPCMASILKIPVTYEPWLPPPSALFGTISHLFKHLGPDPIRPILFISSLLNLRLSYFRKSFINSLVRLFYLFLTHSTLLWFKQTVW